MSRRLVFSLSSNVDRKSDSVEWNRSSFSLEIVPRELLLNPTVESSNLVENRGRGIASNSRCKNSRQQSLAIKSRSQISSARCGIGWSLRAHESISHSIHMNEGDSSAIVAVQHRQRQSNLPCTPRDRCVSSSAESDQLTRCAIANNSRLTENSLDGVVREWDRFVQLNNINYFMLSKLVLQLTLMTAKSFSPVNAL